MNSLKFPFIFFLLFSGAVQARETDVCKKLLTSTQQIRRDDFSTLMEALKTFKSSGEVLDGLPESVQKSEVRFHTSRSPIKASAEFPRKVYLDESDPERPFIFAFSMLPDREPVLEIQSFDRNTKQTSFFVTKWNEQGELLLEKNPARCFTCHSGGRPIFSGMPSRGHWPFIYNEDIPNAYAMEKKLSKWNIEMQMERIPKQNFDRKWIQLLNSAFTDTDEVFEKNFAKSKSQYKNHEIEDYYYSQREVFLQLMKAQPPLLTEQDHRQIRVLRVLEIQKMAGLLELLSLHVRPGNYELGTGSYDSIKNWVENLNRDAEKNRRSWWPF